MTKGQGDPILKSVELHTYMSHFAKPKPFPYPIVYFSVQNKLQKY